jgi:hypothetical protein
MRSHREPAVAPVVDRSHHIFFPFFGGKDDRVALRFVLQLAQNSNVTATIAHFNSPNKSESLKKEPEVTSSDVSSDLPGNSSKITIHETVDTGTLYATAAQDTALLHTLRDSLPSGLASRVVFVDVATTSHITDCLSHARQEIGQSPNNAGDLVVLGRGSHARITEAFHIHNPEMRKTLGPVAEAIISGGVRASVLVLKAGDRGLDS